jgi:hypothetical protein
MQFNPVVALAEDSQRPMQATLGGRLEIFVDVVSLLLQIADVSLRKVLAVISKFDEENPIVVYGKIL